jgi:hypothetical protein
MCRADRGFIEHESGHQGVLSSRFEIQCCELRAWDFDAWGSGVRGRVFEGKNEEAGWCKV